MRKLLFVPVIHMEQDLGSLAPYLTDLGKSIYGTDKWSNHRETVSKFWDSIGDYFDLVEAAGLKIYQDGLPADGALGLKIIEEGAKTGSKNHEIVLALVRKGGEIRQTEDPELLKEEYRQILKLTQSKTVLSMGPNYFEYKLSKERLAKARDDYISQKINATLQVGEVGVLFIGAYHSVLPLLSKDIEVQEVKSQAKVKGYFDELLHGADKQKFDHLSNYLTSSVAIQTV